MENYKTAEKLNKEMEDFFTGEFIETNPIPIKAALAMKGMIEETYRLPMCELTPKNREKWQDMLVAMKLI